MYKATHRAEAFGERVASRSIRPFRKGYSDQGFELLQPRSLLEQRLDLERQITELENATRAADDAVRASHGLDANARSERSRLKSVLANAVRQKGHFDATVRDASRLAFETLFVRVANARLHRDIFLILTSEARDLWRTEGWATATPDDDWRMTKKKMKKRAASVDTHPKDGDALAAPLVSGAVAKPDAQTAHPIQPRERK